MILRVPSIVYGIWVPTVLVEGFGASGKALEDALNPKPLKP